MNFLLSIIIQSAQAEGLDPNGFIKQIGFKSSVGLDITACGAGGSNVPDGGFLACYISSLYTFFVQGAIILAVVMIMFGGFQWLLAAGNSSKISEAKSTVSAAIFGLILALTSYLLFAQVNNKLVDLQSLDINKVAIKIPGGINDAPPGYCIRTGEVPDLERIADNTPVLRNAEQQKLTFHPSLVKVMNNLNKDLEVQLYRPLLNSVTDGNIWPNSVTQDLCRRETPGGDLQGKCQHDDSYHYGGPANECAFNAEYPPVSCAVDLKVIDAFYPRIAADMIRVGFDYVQCEKYVTEPSGRIINQKTPCLPFNSINHIHGELFGYPDKPGDPYCYSVMKPEL